MVVTRWQMTGFFDAVQEFDDATIRTVITPYLVEPEACHSWSEADSLYEILLAVTKKNQELDVKRSRRELESGAGP
ncbi:unnamed protein product [Hymenolepis diminuta]|uniref:Uncharacterized protein n=1 Tax=Hymenolepis diminuta TaxID=6216 RepID=A0A564Z5R3_HYMDI|nr:unnamed protein product [Hymenolepis diminuta]